MFIQQAKKQQTFRMLAQKFDLYSRSAVVWRQSSQTLITGSIPTLPVYGLVGEQIKRLWFIKHLSSSNKAEKAIYRYEDGPFLFTMFNKIYLTRLKHRESFIETFSYHQPLIKVRERLRPSSEPFSPNHAAFLNTSFNLIQDGLFGFCLTSKQALPWGSNCG